MKHSNYPPSSPHFKKKNASEPAHKKNQFPEIAIAPERIQKVLSRGGLGSRREIERWIEEQRFTINGKPVTLGQPLKIGDTLVFDGRIIRWEKFIEQQPTQVLIYNKPVGEVVTRNDPEKRPTIFTRLPKLAVGRWIAVGRLDINTSGLLLVTNNGELANRLMHPSGEIEREYAVRILGEASDEVIAQLKQGIELDDGLARFSDVQFFDGDGANKWYHVVVNEGRNRLVRRLWESQHLVVSRLIRVRYGPIILPKRVRANDIYELNADELATLLEFVGLDKDNVAIVAPVPTLVEKTARIKGGHKTNPSAHNKNAAPKYDWTYKADAQEQGTPEKPLRTTPAKKRYQANFNGKKPR